MTDKKEPDLYRGNFRRKKVMALRRRTRITVSTLAPSKNVDKRKRSDVTESPSASTRPTHTSKKTKDPVKVGKVKPFVKLPRWSSESINSNLRLTSTRRIGLFNNGCRSALVSLQKMRPVPEEMRAREASDLQRILGLARSSQSENVDDVLPMNPENTQTLHLSSSDSEADGEDELNDIPPQSSPKHFRTIRGDSGTSCLSGVPEATPPHDDNAKHPPDQDSEKLQPLLMKEKLDSLYAEICNKTMEMPGLRAQKLSQLKSLFAKRKSSSISLLHDESSLKQGPVCSQSSRTSSSAVSCRISPAVGKWSASLDEGPGLQGDTRPSTTVERPVQDDFKWMEGKHQTYSSPTALDLLNVASECCSGRAFPEHQRVTSQTLKEWSGDQYSTRGGFGLKSKRNQQVEPQFHLSGHSYRQTHLERPKPAATYQVCPSQKISCVTGTTTAHMGGPPKNSTTKRERNVDLRCSEAHKWSELQGSTDQQEPRNMYQSSRKAWEPHTDPFSWFPTGSRPTGAGLTQTSYSKMSPDLKSDIWWTGEEETKHRVTTLEDNGSPWSLPVTVSPLCQPATPEDHWRPRGRKMF